MFMIILFNKNNLIVVFHFFSLIMSIFLDFMIKPISTDVRSAPQLNIGVSITATTIQQKLILLLTIFCFLQLFDQNTILL